MDIGIDLGTTFSVMAVKGRVQLAEGYPEGMYLEECDVTIIPTPFGEFTVPSVFWASPDNPSEILVGSEAKQKAQEGESPVMFSKRSIGTDEPLRLHDRTYTAKEVATHVLKYLKDCAERALGQPVQRAVVTHPAYFDRNQVEETREAAVAAGFDTALPEQLMMEPAAAALAFIQGDQRDPLRVLTYDLGGGTFDVTVLERREGVITMKAFDGDHLLGGYNFDRELVQWLLDRVKATGRTIPYDENNPEDRGRRARMLQLAEKIKIQLSEQRGPKVAVPIKAQDILVDSEGKNVQILERITREQYAELIREHLDKTIACCQSALGKAGMQLEEIHTVLLVGGSTYGQWVTEAVSRALGVEAQLYNPDLCVAAGAALQAAKLPPVASGAGIKLTLNVESTSSLPSINVTGCIRAEDDSELKPATRAELKVLLTTPQTGTLGPCDLNPEGFFLFKNVALLEDEPTQFTLQVTDGKGLTRLTHAFPVVYQPENAPVTEISTTLPKPLYLMTGAGLIRIAEEGKQLPAQCEVSLKRLHGDPTVEIPVYQEDVEISRVRVDNIPAQAGEGSQIIVTVQITQKNEMRGEAKVLQRAGGAVVATCPVHIRFPPLALPDLSELHARFDELEGRREELIALTSDPDLRTELSGKGAKISRSLQKKFAEQEPDKQEIYRALKDLDRLVNPPPDDMDPPRAQFQRLTQECRDFLAAQGTDPQLDSLRTALTRLESDGNDAFRTKNHKKWAATCESLAKLHERVAKAAGGGGEGGQEQELPPPALLKDHFRQEADGLRSALQIKREELELLDAYASKFKPRLEAIEKAIDKMEADIDKVDENLESKRALAQLQLAMRDREKLKKRIRDAGVDTTV